MRLLIYSQEAADQFHRERGGRRADAGWRAKNPKVTRKLSVYTIQCLFYHTVQRYAFSKLIPKPQILVCAKSHLAKAGARHNKRWSESKLRWQEVLATWTKQKQVRVLHCGVEWRPRKYTSDTVTFTYAKVWLWHGSCSSPPGGGLQYGSKTDPSWWWLKLKVHRHYWFSTYSWILKSLWKMKCLVTCIFKLKCNLLERNF